MMLKHDVTAAKGQGVTKPVGWLSVVSYTAMFL